MPEGVNSHLFSNFILFLFKNLQRKHRFYPLDKILG